MTPASSARRVRSSRGSRTRRATSCRCSRSADGDGAGHRSEGQRRGRPGVPLSTAPPRHAGRREWLGLSVLSLACVVYAMDLTVLNLALPALSADLRPTSTELLWIVDIYGFMVAGALITMGALGDRIGGRRLLMIGAATFAACSIVAAFSVSATMLIVTRAILGLAGATVAPSTLSLIRTLFQDPGQRTVAIGVWVTSYSAGGALGPLVGGALLELFWWGSVLLIGVPVMVLLLVLGPRVLPEQSERSATSVDLRSVALSLAAVLAVVAALKRAAIDGIDPAALALMVAGGALGWVFVRRQRRLADPLIELALFRSPAFSGALAANLLAFFVGFGMSVFLAQYLQSVLGLTPLAAGLWSLPTGLGFVAGATLAPRLASRFAKPMPIGGGLVVGALGYLIVALTDSALAPVVIGPSVAAIGLGVVVTLVTDIAVGAASPEHVGAASATSETSAELGGALGIAVLGSLGAAAYRAAVAGALPPAAPAAARDTLGGAIDLSHELGGPAGELVASAARDAFGHAMAVTASVGAALLVAAAVATVALLRREP